MALDPETEWILVASGLVAHADGVLDGEECDRLLGMLDDELDPDLYSEWLGIVGDKLALEERLDALPPPPADKHREVLGEAWTMAMVDGERREEEVVVLQELAQRLGVEGVQLEFWMQAWADQERKFSEACAGAATAMFGGLSGGAEDRKLYDALVDVLPTTDEHREELRAMGAVQADLSDVGRVLAGFSRSFRMRVFKLLAPLIFESEHEDEVHDRFTTLAEAAGMDPDMTEKILLRARD